MDISFSVFMLLLVALGYFVVKYIDNLEYKLNNHILDFGYKIKSLGYDVLTLHANSFPNPRLCQNSSCPPKYAMHRRVLAQYLEIPNNYITQTMWAHSNKLDDPGEEW